jgi:hypothetical protein
LGHVRQIEYPTANKECPIPKEVGVMTGVGFLTAKGRERGLGLEWILGVPVFPDGEGDWLIGD